MFFDEIEQSIISCATHIIAEAFLLSCSKAASAPKHSLQTRNANEQCALKHHKVLPHNTGVQSKTLKYSRRSSTETGHLSHATWQTCVRGPAADLPKRFDHVGHPQSQIQSGHARVSKTSSDKLRDCRCHRPTASNQPCGFRSQVLQHRPPSRARPISLATHNALRLTEGTPSYSRSNCALCRWQRDHIWQSHWRGNLPVLRPSVENPHPARSL